MKDSSPIRANSRKKKLIQLLLSAFGTVAVCTLAILSGNRILTIAACGLPAITGAVWLAVSYGRANAYG